MERKITKEVKMPWSDCKVAFPIYDSEAVWNSDIKLNLPDEWTLIETDGTGARYVAIFRVNGIPKIEDGEKVGKILLKIDKKAEQKDRRELKRYRQKHGLE